MMQDGTCLRINKEEAEKCFRTQVEYELAQYARKYVRSNYKSIHTSLCRYISAKQAKQIAKDALILLVTGQYSDIEYAIEDTYKELGCPSSYYEDEIIEDTVVLGEGEVFYMLTNDAVKAAADIISVVKLKNLLNEIAPDITNGNKKQAMCKQALNLIREEQFTDLEYALEEVIDRQSTFKYEKHPLLEVFDKTLVMADDNYMEKVGLIAIA